MKSFVHTIVYSDTLKGDKYLDRYLAKWYVAVLMLEIIGRIGWSLTVPSFGILWILAVQYSFTADEPDG